MGFLGDTKESGRQMQAMPLRPSEVSRILGHIDAMSESEEISEVIFYEGESVKVIDGPFASMEGTVETVDNVRKKLTVSVRIFGRKTPMELSFMQVEKE
jgi:transcriptional antiterminator NusG